MKSAVSSLRHSVPSLHSLALFEAAARLLNFSKAANELSITQPAVSHGIRQLETALGSPLFIRERRSLSLTPEGERLYSAVSEGLSEIADTVDAIRGAEGRQHNLTIGVSTSMAARWLLPRLSALRGKFPSISFDIRCLDRDIDLSAGGLDVHLRVGDGKWPGYDSVALWPEEIFPVCSPDYILSRELITEVEGLLRHDLIHYEDPFRLRLGWREWLREFNIAPPHIPSAVRTNDYLCALECAERGHGIALGWHPIIDDAIAEGRLVVAYPQSICTGRSFFMITPRGAATRKPLAHFLDWLVEETSADQRK